MAGPTRKPFPERRIYRTPKATVDAFWYVVRTYNDEYVNRWLDEHPSDKAFLLDLYRQRQKQRRAP
ncbi:hypothetical protein [Taklimakanibacter deserti]|uniref:hypothetical protein n=1 Tax=Taklimakanibacter deserti TaxID=2267839 RepID=UPI000E6572CB